MDLTHSFESPSAQIIFDPSPNSSYLKDVSRTAPLGSSISSTTIISGKISPMLPLDSVFITPTIPFSIVSVSSLWSNNNLVVFSSQSATIIPNNDLILSKFNSFIDFLSKNSQILLVPLNVTDNLYKLPLRYLPNIPVINDFSNLPVSLNSVHRYSTIKTRTVAEEVDMVHRLFGHRDTESLISLLSSPSLCNFSTHLSAATIRKHFPLSCPDRSLGNLQRRKWTYWRWMGSWFQRKVDRPRWPPVAYVPTTILLFHCSRLFVKICICSSLS